MTRSKTERNAAEGVIYAVPRLYAFLCFIFYFNKTDNRRPLVFVKLGFYILYGFFKLGYHYVFQRVDAALVALDFVGEHSYRLFNLGKA